jgi:transcriptional regulator with XRE-family HTH domain
MSTINSKISGRQIAAARELLNITQTQLAAAAGLHQQIVGRIESARVLPRENTVAKLRQALEHRGIEFTNGDSPGVKLRAEKALIRA